MMRGKKSGAEKQAARRFGEFGHSVRRNLRQAHRILVRADQKARRCYEKAGAAMLDAKASSGMSEEEFAAWLAPFGLSQDRLLQCLELGQVIFDRRNAEVIEREETRVVKEGRDQMSREAIQREGEESERRQRELVQYEGEERRQHGTLPGCPPVTAQVLQELRFPSGVANYRAKRRHVIRIGESKRPEACVRSDS